MVRPDFGFALSDLLATPIAADILNAEKSEKSDGKGYGKRSDFGSNKGLGIWADSGSEVPIKSPVKTYEGTAERDFFNLAEFEYTSLKTYGGDDEVALYGSAEYLVNLGADDDVLQIHTDGQVTATGGSGDDLILVHSFSHHELQGGLGTDTIGFQHLQHGIKVDLMRNTAYINQYDLQKMTLSGFEDVYGTNYNDFIRANGADNIVVAGDGDDQIFTEGGNDRVEATDGNNYIDVGAGDDYVQTLFGDDIIIGGAGNDHLSSLSGRNHFFTGTGTDWVGGGESNDWVYGGAAGDDGSDTFLGGSDDYAGAIRGDTLDYTLADAGVIIDTRLGTVRGDGAGLNVTGSGLVEQMVDSFQGFERYHGSNHDDIFRSKLMASEIEIFFGGKGDDVFHARFGYKEFDGGQDDFNYSAVPGQEGFDVVSYAQASGSVLADLSVGEGTFTSSLVGFLDTSRHVYADIDGIIGGNLSDTLIGNDADNLLDGGRSSDTFTGNGGADTFRFVYETGDSFFERVTDFTGSEDVLHLRNHSRGGQLVDSFADLDTTGDSLLTSDDAAFYQFGDNPGYLILDGGMIELDGVSSITKADFIFG